MWSGLYHRSLLVCFSAELFISTGQNVSASMSAIVPGDVKQGGTNCSHGAQRLVVLCVQTY